MVHCKGKALPANQSTSETYFNWKSAFPRRYVKWSTVSQKGSATGMRWGEVEGQVSK